jgi:hypothetical protein
MGGARFVASTLRVIGALVVVITVATLMFWIVRSHRDGADYQGIPGPVMAGYAMSGVVSGLLLIATGEIVGTLVDISEKLDRRERP